MYFLFSKASKFKTRMARVPYNKLLTNLACSSRNGECWPSVVFCTDLAALGPYCHDLRGQYSPVRPSCSVSKRLIFHHRITPMSWSVQYAFWSQNFFKLKLAAVWFAFSNVRRTQSFDAVVQITTKKSTKKSAKRYVKGYQFLWKVHERATLKHRIRNPE